MHSQQMENFAHTCHAGNGRWLDMWRTSHFSPTTKSQTSCGGLQQCIHIIIKAYAYNEECSLEILDMLNGFKTLLTKPKCYSCLPSHSQAFLCPSSFEPWPWVSIPGWRLAVEPTKLMRVTSEAPPDSRGMGCTRKCSSMSKIDWNQRCCTRHWPSSFRERRRCCIAGKTDVNIMMEREGRTERWSNGNIMRE